jgi:hypothetical protein
MATNVLARIPQRRRRRIRSKAERAAARIYQPEIEMYRAQRKGVRRQYRRDVQANRGVVNYTQDAISQVPLKGLTGKARQQVAAEMALSSKDVAASLPMLNAEARQARTAGLADIKADIIGARVERAQDAGRRYATLLGQEATYQTQKQADRAEHRVEKRARKQDLHVARRRVQMLLAEAPGDVPPPVNCDAPRLTNVPTRAVV